MKNLIISILKEILTCKGWVNNCLDYDKINKEFKNKTNIKAIINSAVTESSITINRIERQKAFLSFLETAIDNIPKILEGEDSLIKYYIKTEFDSVERQRKDIVDQLKENHITHFITALILISCSIDKYDSLILDRLNLPAKLSIVRNIEHLDLVNMEYIENRISEIQNDSETTRTGTRRNGRIGWPGGRT